LEGLAKFLAMQVFFYGWMATESMEIFVLDPSNLPYKVYLVLTLIWC